MKAGWRLGLHVALWVIASPLIQVLAGSVGSSAFSSLGEFAPMLTLFIEVSILLPWAAWIYWRCVPHAPGVGRRIVYAVAFVCVLWGAGYAALWATWFLATMLFGA